MCDSAFCSVIEAVAETMGIDLDELNTDFGRFFVSWIRANGHDRVSRHPSPYCLHYVLFTGVSRFIQLMHSLGGNFVEFVR